MRKDEIEPNIFIIIGAKGDLTRRKLLPAIYNLLVEGYLNDKCLILATARDVDMNHETYRAFARTALSDAGFTKDQVEKWYDQRLFFHSIGDATPEDYIKLGKYLEEMEKEHGFPGNRTFYLALPPPVFGSTIENLGKAGLNKSSGWTRLVIEKPFGRDLQTAVELNQLVHKYFDESQVYRIDHYLGKETVQNLLVLRFANDMFESLWNRRHVQSVQITVAEELGVEKRAAYYEKAGALRDMVQNHLTQILTLVAMEVPVTYDAASIHFEKEKVLKSISPIRPEDVVFGQYTKGEIEGKKLPGYLDEPGVNPQSKTETFVAMKLDVTNWRWQGVPFYIRSGKRLPQHITQVYINFRRPPVWLFESMGSCQIHSNALLITIQPIEEFALLFDIKIPGESFDLKTLPLRFNYHEAFKNIPDAYQTLLYDILTGDQTLFVHSGIVESAWKLYTPLLDGKIPIHPYEAGTWGPKEADRLFANGALRCMNL